MKSVIGIVVISVMLVCSAAVGAQNYGYDPSIQQRTNEMQQQQLYQQQQQQNFQQEQIQRQNQQLIMQQMLQEQRNQNGQYQRSPMMPGYGY